jgi:activator of HSP90 ATPase
MVAALTAARPVSAATANENRTALHQDVALKASPQSVYDTLLDAKAFAAFTGAPADIDPRPGGALNLFDGQVSARNIELIPARRIVQAWRPNDWAAGVYSIVRFELKPAGAGTMVSLDHTGFPQGEYDSLSSGWVEHYWDPLRKRLG